MRSFRVHDKHSHDNAFSGCNMAAVQCAVSVVVSLLLGLSFTSAATVTMTSTLGVKGISGHTVTCQYGLAQGETFRYMNIYRGSGDVLIAVMLASDSSPLWTSDADSTLKNRATLSGSPGSPVTMEFSDTLCSDNGEVYKCEISYTTSSVVSQVEDTTTVRVEAPPQSPQPMAITPQVGNSVTEFTVLTFSCTGNVGLPAGTFQWFTFFGENPINVTDQATQGTARPEDCTFSRTSTLRYTTTRTQVGEDLVVRCRVYHPTQGSNNDPMDCGTNGTFCSMSQRISVQYPVNVSVSHPALTVTEGESVTLGCTADSNPSANKIQWYLGDIDNVLSNSTELRLADLNLTDTGVYTCIGYNVIYGAVYSSTASTSLIVAERPPPTTTVTSVSIKTTGYDRDEVTDTDHDCESSVATIVAAVLGALLFLVLVGNAAYVIRKRMYHTYEKSRPRQEQEPHPYTDLQIRNTNFPIPTTTSNLHQQPSVSNVNTAAVDGSEYSNIYDSAHYNPAQPGHIYLDLSGDPSHEKGRTSPASRP